MTPTISEDLINGEKSKLFDALEHSPESVERFPCLPSVILCAVPLLDFEEAWDRLVDLHEAGNRDALVWLSYIYANHAPIDNQLFQGKTSCESAEEYYSLANVNLFDNKKEQAVESLRSSVNKRRFPNNLRLLLSLSPSENNVDVSAEVEVANLESVRLASLKGLYSSYWKELITGEYVTSQVWQIERAS